MTLTRKQYKLLGLVILPLISGGIMMTFLIGVFSQMTDSTMNKKSWTAEEYQAFFQSKSGKRDEYTAGEITKAIIREAEVLGFDCWRQNNLAVKGRKFIGRKGVFDVIGIHKQSGIFFAAETKTKGDRLSEEQKKFLKLINESGGIAVVVRDVREAKLEIRERLKNIQPKNK